jgi:vacuolar-type H+-ATPase subunit B/Vma2
VSSSAEGIAATVLRILSYHSRNDRKFCLLFKAFEKRFLEQVERQLLTVYTAMPAGNPITVVLPKEQVESTSLELLKAEQVST